MGLMLLGACVVAAVNLHEGRLQPGAIVNAVLNGLSFLGQMGEANRGESAGAASALSFSPS